MRRLTCVIVLGASLASATAIGAEQDTQSPDLERFSGSTVLVKYIAGTQKTDLLGKLGCLRTSESGGLIFAAYKKQSRASRFGSFLVHLLNPSWSKGKGQCKNGGSPLRIGYDKIEVLARGKVQKGDSASAGLAALVTTTGFVTALKDLEGGARIAVGAIAGAAAITAVAAYLNRRTNNYIAIFFNPADPAPKLSTGQVESSTQITAQVAQDKRTSSITKTETTTQKPPDDLFCKCDVAVFQVIDPHDYWNTSVFLNAKTGKTFVSESAEKGVRGFFLQIERWVAHL